MEVKQIKLKFIFYFMISWIQPTQGSGVLKLELKSDPPADEFYTEQFIKSYQACNSIFDNKNKKLDELFKNSQKVEIFLNVSPQGNIKRAYVPFNPHDDYDIKKWTSCLTKKTFQLKFPTLPKEIRYHFVLSVRKA